ncbi:MAG: TerB family tellurite resistance protein [Roseibium sp.]|uniref:tellurite resistance TerB family protein n=1 Tax=Roseibium sp. TaxID=1936156 RepID=UPI001B2A57A8|nr:TerB family tellurite resistance protein [Roseibium sp.]MBO6892260.1 TerB family tellurite resistance protein [Roseibium sp.]MBO6930876.1 TerB family tellurite resistance protein [Roseibium sp.]
MLNALKSFVREITFGDSGKKTFAEDDKRLAAAALLFHLIDIDGVIEESESSKLRQILQKHYELSDAETTELIDAARQRDEEAVDLYGFTSVLKRTTDEEERLAIVEMMWEIVYADGHVHEFEDNTIWRVAELLGVSTRDRMTLRHKVAQTAPEEGDLEQS